MDEQARDILRRQLANILDNLEGDPAKLTREQLEWKLRVVRHVIEALLEAVKGEGADKP